MGKLRNYEKRTKKYIFLFIISFYCSICTNSISYNKSIFRSRITYKEIYNILFIPNNCAHGFLTLEDNTIVTYLVSGEYNPDSEHSIVWNTIGGVESIINTYTRGQKLIISEKDALGK